MPGSAAHSPLVPGAGQLVCSIRERRRDLFREREVIPTPGYTVERARHQAARRHQVSSSPSELRLKVDEVRTSEGRVRG